MPDFRVSTPAQWDIRAIWAYLERESMGGRETADRVEAAFYGAFSELATLPAMGHTRPDIRRSGLFCHNVFSYVMIFRREPKVVILRVLHGARNLSRLLH